MNPDQPTTLGPKTYNRVAVFGGVYSNHIALETALADARARDVDQIICLGDLGAFGPNPDKAAGVLREAGIPVVRGKYDDSVARGLDDCQCGYTDPRDNQFARLSYQYTFQNTSAEYRAWMGDLPDGATLPVGRMVRRSVSRKPTADERVLMGVDHAHAFPAEDGARQSRRRDPRYPYRYPLDAELG